MLIICNTSLEGRKEASISSSGMRVESLAPAVEMVPAMEVILGMEVILAMEVVPGMVPAAAQTRMPARRMTAVALSSFLSCRQNNT